MEPNLTQAVVLAGGIAERMRPYSDAMPKALMPVGGLALITRQLSHLAANGITHAVVSSRYKHRQISEFVGGGSQYGLTVRHAVEPYPLGTAGAIRYASEALDDPTAPFLVVNGSVSTDMELAPLAARHAEARASVTMALVRYVSERPITIESPDGKIHAMPKVTTLPYWISSGLSVFQPYAVKMLPDVGEITDFYDTIAAEGLLAAYQAPDQVFWRELTSIGDVYAYPDAAQG